MRIALAGNPNSGKTTMYNALTGKSEQVGNWAGVTVERKEHPIKKSLTGTFGELIAVDLPGAYSMSPFTSEESVTSSYVREEHPDVIINIVDATNLSRSLFFTTQLLELGIPVVVALNKTDVNKKRETEIDGAELSKMLGCPVVETVSTSGAGLEELVGIAAGLVGREQKAPYTDAGVDLTDKASVEKSDRRRYAFVNEIVSKVESRKVFTKDVNVQDKVDDVLTNKWLGIPIFAFIMFLVFWISQVGPGVWIAEGYTFERSDRITVLDVGFSKADENGDPILGLWESQGSETLVFEDNGTFVMRTPASTVSGAYTFDGEELSMNFGAAALDYGYDSRDITLPGLVTLIDSLGEWVGSAMESARVSAVVTSVIVDGIIGGVGAVLGFLPLVMVMYFLIALLEDCGYMARATVVLDPIFKKVGLSGKSVIPFIVGTGCAIPGVMACRTIRNERERRATAMLAPFMPCGAKLPVIALFAGAFFGDSPWVGPLMYFAGIAIILLGAFIINQITCYKRKRSFFVIELPEYKAPSLSRAAHSMLSRGWAYIVKAGTVILVCNFVVHLMQSFTWTLSPAEEASESILASVATPFAYIFAPIVGVVAWQLAAAAITGFIAKENVVGTLAVCFVGLENFIDTEALEMMDGAGASVAGILAITRVAALAYLMFNLFSPPCFAAIGAMNSEMKSKKWLFGGIGLQLGMGYSVAFLVYFFGTLFTGVCFGTAWMPILGWFIVLAFAGTLTGIIIRNQRKFREEHSERVKEAVSV